MKKNHHIEFLNMLSLRGPNIWTYRPALEVWVDIGDLEDAPSNTIPGFYERLTGWLPSLIEHRCGVGERGGFLQRVREGTWAGHILEHVTLEFQNLAGMQSGFGKARETSKRGVYKVVVRARNEQVSRASLQAGRELVLAAFNDTAFDVNAAVLHLRELVDSRCLGPSTTCIVAAANERSIPSLRLNDGNLVQLGYGIHQHRIWTAETDQTSAIAETISGDKDLTKTLLESCGLPVPEGRMVTSAEDAWDAAQDIGLPVVIKPVDGNHGRGVSTELTKQADIIAAFDLAHAEGSEVLVERFIRGNEHRLLVVDGKLVAAARGETAYVIGDGHSSVRQLVDNQLNSDPRRGTNEDCPLNIIEMDKDAAVRLDLTRQGLSPNAIPTAGQQVLIQRNGNVAFDVTDLVHPDVAADVALAARIIGLDVAGIDLVAEDISRPLREQGGAIVEVNAGPGLLMHLKPIEGTPRPVGQAIVASLFPSGSNGRIPIVGVTGTHGSTVVARIIARLLQLSGKHCGLACAEGHFLDRRQVEAGNRANWSAARKLLLNPMIEAAVIENDAESILREGLAYDRSQVSVVTHLDPTMQLPDYFIETPEQLFNVLRTVVDVVLDDGVAVLNADDEQVVQMSELCDGEVIFFGLHANQPVLIEHLAQGKRAAFVRDGKLILAQGAHERQLIRINTIPGVAGVQTEHVVAAVAAAWAQNISDDVIRAGVETLSFD
jgi:cyanophycin synthetase